MGAEEGRGWLFQTPLVGPLVFSLWRRRYAKCEQQCCNTPRPLLQACLPIYTQASLRFSILFSATARLPVLPLLFVSVVNQGMHMHPHPFPLSRHHQIGPTQKLPLPIHQTHTQYPGTSSCSRSLPSWSSRRLLWCWPACWAG